MTTVLYYLAFYLISPCRSWQEVYAVLVIISLPAGLWRLAIQDNELRSVPGRAFSGLERSLWQLDLSGNRLTRVPHQAVRPLANLRLLDLSRESGGSADWAALGVLCPLISRASKNRCLLVNGHARLVM